jgi:predicted RecA/RadA family phage recombinase
MARLTEAYLQPGKVITLAAPYDRTGGQGCLVGSLFGVAAADVLSGGSMELITEGVFSLAKLSAQAWTEGQLIYWDNTAKHCTSVSTSNTRIGCATAVAANPSAVGNVRLNGQAAPTGA